MDLQFNIQLFSPESDARQSSPFHGQSIFMKIVKYCSEFVIAFFRYLKTTFTYPLVLVPTAIKILNEVPFHKYRGSKVANHIDINTTMLLVKKTKKIRLQQSGKFPPITWNRVPT